jgi:DNA-binding transcriptional ArsR family regulator
VPRRRKAERQPATPEEVRALAHPLRLRIIRLLYDGPLTNQELAARLSTNPASVLHHVRTLLRTGFIEPDVERRGPRGRIEKLYRTTGKSWRVSIDAGLPEADNLGRAALDAFVAEVTDAGAAADLDTSRLALVLSPEHKALLEQRVEDVLQEFAALPPDPGGERLAIFVAMHRRV